MHDHLTPGTGSSLTVRHRVAAGFAGGGLLLAGPAVAIQLLGVRDDTTALISIATAHLLLVGLGLGGIAIVLGRSRFVVISTMAIAVAAAAVLGDEWISMPAGDGPDSLTVLSWNIEFGSEAVDQLSTVLLSTDADIVALQELTPDGAAAIEADPAVVRAYPHRVLRPDNTVLGLGLLSRYPMRLGTESTSPAVLSATVTLDDGRTLRVLNAHPLPGRILTFASVPVGFDRSSRDVGLDAVRRQADRLAAKGGPVVLLGDFNVAPTEPAYDRLRDGWRDAHVEAGAGPGWTWRPSTIQAFPAGLLRIDYVLVTPDVTPISSRQDCSRPGDHCVVTVALQLPGDTALQQ